MEINKKSSPNILTRTCFTNIQKNPKYDTFLDVDIVWDFAVCQLVEDLKQSLAYMNIQDYQILLNKGTYYEHLKTRIQIKIKHMTDRDKFIPEIPTKRWVDYLDEDDEDEDEAPRKKVAKKPVKKAPAKKSRKAAEDDDEDDDF